MLQASRWAKGAARTAILIGDDARRAAAKLLPALNAVGANRNQVRSALETASSAANPDELFSRYLRAPVRVPATLDNGLFVGEPYPEFQPVDQLLAKLPAHVRLALEMATHEDSERRALDGELALLEQEWKQAEEIAAIADDMFVDDATREQLAVLKHARNS